MKRGNLVFTALLFCIAILYLIPTLGFPFKAKIFPLLVLSTALILLTIQIAGEAKKLRRKEEIEKEEFSRKHLVVAAWLLGTVVMLVTLGFMGTVVLLPFLYLRYEKESWLLSIALPLGSAVFFYGLFDLLLKMRLYPGVLLPKLLP